MGKIDFMELANSRIDWLKEHQCTYQETTFISIKEDNSIFISTTPHILSDAVACILIHRFATTTYCNYSFEGINNQGEVQDGRLDDEFEIQRINSTLYLKGDSHYYFHGSWNNADLKKACKLYLQLRPTKNIEERKLISQLFNANDKIFDLESMIDGLKFQNALLEKEKEMYKDLLDQISSLVSSKQ